jgi:hypothetical protein
MSSGARLLALLGLPRLPPLPPLDAATRRTYEEFTEGPAEPRPPGQLLTYLRWLATNRPVLFHGSQRDNIGELRPDRESSDSTAFGNQRAVFATDDPVWAMWFALLTRGPGFRSTRNGVWSLRGERQYRQYFFSVDSDRPDTSLLGDGWLYVLPRAGFTPEPAIAGLLQSGQGINPNPVKPQARLAVSPNDFPFADLIGRHTSNDSMLRTLRTVRSAFRSGR